uniref:Uncharacterized protein n=1 Tax=Chromera velia CCMP2878 TaxID=1169474 RepID=A0A0G4GF81_9ALVE|eukprot:Cvel_21616.t1-p1 / transcript=Cvel_21616.t1 / gene=Cvel_21616 / organism=Chromera_velia_CCMP2878 / gene_product=hypothetical protein / transcript_product=hypothetical protein / location=Cvel_scaffold2042:26305-35538(-) / protein_length=302 / sequence_SO=supercontig / SO=protein_coding / is_pseudo=false
MVFASDQEIETAKKNKQPVPKYSLWVDLLSSPDECRKYLYTKVDGIANNKSMSAAYETTARRALLTHDWKDLAAKVEDLHGQRVLRDAFEQLCQAGCVGQTFGRVASYLLRGDLSEDNPVLYSFICLAAQELDLSGNELQGPSSADIAAPMIGEALEEGRLSAVRTLNLAETDMQEADMTAVFTALSAGRAPHIQILHLPEITALSSQALASAIDSAHLSDLREVTLVQSTKGLGLAALQTERKTRLSDSICTSAALFDPSGSMTMPREGKQVAQQKAQPDVNLSSVSPCPSAQASLGDTEE